MSDTYTWPQRCPDLVQDVSLKRARIDNEDNTSSIRTAISGVDADHPLPVLINSDSAQWFLRGRLNGLDNRYYRLQWFYLSPQILPYTSSPINNQWFAVIKRSTNDSMDQAADLTKPPAFQFREYSSGAQFPGGWVASNFGYTYLTSVTLLGFKSGNTDFSSPDVEVNSGRFFYWDGEDFKNCQERFDSSILYLQNTGGSPSDNAWSGTGDGTVISLLKGIANIF